MNEEDGEHIDHHVDEFKGLLEVLGIDTKHVNKDRNESKEMACEYEGIGDLVVTVLAIKCVSSIANKENEQKDDMEHGVL